MSIALLLHCRSLEESRYFYQENLGFRIEEVNSDTISAQLDDVDIMLTRLNLWQMPAQMSGTVYISVADVDERFARYKDKAEVVWPLQDMPYGTREFAIRDCNTYILAFVQKTQV